MGERITFECNECGEPGAIDSSSLNFITSATAYDKEELYLCDKHFSEQMAGVTIDLSIGTTSDTTFKQQRQEREAQKKAGEIEEAQATETIRIEQTFHDPGTDERRAVVMMPSVAKHHLKQAPTQIVNPMYDRDYAAWTIRASQQSIEETVDILERKGWTVDVRIDGA